MRAGVESRSGKDYSFLPPVFEEVSRPPGEGVGFAVLFPGSVSYDEIVVLKFECPSGLSLVEPLFLCESF